MKQQRYKQKNLAYEELDNYLLVIDHERGKIITLNKTAAFIWLSLNKAKTETEILHLVESKYANPFPRQIRVVIQQLLKTHLITLFPD